MSSQKMSADVQRFRAARGLERSQLGGRRMSLALLTDILVGLLVNAARDVNRSFLLSRINSDYVSPEAARPIVAREVINFT